jgi:ElaB/YqjD/DUF883 family membrane-anchored ribosome-binding protein
MGTSPDHIRAEIDATRGRLSADVDQLADRTSPRRVVNRRARRAKGAVAGLRDRVMGSASQSAHGVTDTARSTAGSLREGTGQATETVRETAEQAGEAVRRAPDQAMRRTQGSPLAAGLIAFGVGALASSLLPTSRAEEETASELLAHNGEALEPVKQAAKESAQHLKEGAGDVARTAAEEVKSTAVDAAHTTQEEVRGRGADVTEQARTSGQQITDEARQRT